MVQEQLYPPIQPYETGLLRLDSLHEMYWEQSGNPHGVPAVFLHGGPGAGATEVHRRFFDPKVYRIIIFDQRGSGRSRPAGALKDNTTGHLCADMEALREHLGIGKWLLFGGSWGSTLALAYGERYPEHCLGFVLRGIFLGRGHEVDWFLYGIKNVFPEAWARLAELLPNGERDDILGAYHRRLLDDDPEIHMPAARAWSAYEGSCSTLIPSPETVAAFSADMTARSLARIETHYFVNGNFLKPNELLDNVGAIQDIPGVIIQGRYDMICPIATADELRRAWPEADYHIVPDAGHSAMDPGIRNALMRATERFKQRF